VTTVTVWRGFTDRLKTPYDLLEKMRADYRRMIDAPGDPFPAFDFFVAAEHIVDWRYPSDAARRKAIRATDPPRTVSHLASGAKHFVAEDSRHASVSSVESEADYGTSLLGRAGSVRWCWDPWDHLRSS
jgi:hypothetical protein